MSIYSFINVLVDKIVDNLETLLEALGPRQPGRKLAKAHSEQAPILTRLKALSKDGGVRALGI